MTSRPQSALKDLQHITEVDTDDALSGRGNLVAPGIDRLPWETVAKNGLDHISTSNMIWVPAAKHPQIAPTEFLEWIKTHGNATSYNKNPVRRQRSALSVTYTSSEEEEEEEEDDTEDDDDDKGNNDDYPSAYTNSNLPIDTTHSFDPSALDQDQTVESIAAPLDTAPVLANSERKSLLRRKALSSRGRQNINRPPSAKHAAAGQPSDTNNNDINGNRSTASDIIDIVTGDNTDSIPLDSQQLCDQPVSMNELVDLGPMPEIEPSPQLLSRMQTVETQILERRSSTPEIDIHSFSSSSSQSQQSQSPQPVTQRKRNELRRSVSDRFSWMSNSEKKRSPWIRGLFDKYRRVDEASKSRSIPPSTKEKPATDSMPSIPPIQRSSSHNLISYLSRKLSFSTSKPTDSSSSSKHPRRRYSNFLQHSGKHSLNKQQPVEADENGVTSNGHRLPIHLERGVYRLSHIKLSNPRRPLREQVIISNFMFWYLSIINMHPHQIHQQQQQQQQYSHQQQQWQQKQQQQQQQQQYSHQDTNSLPSSSPQTEDIRLQMTPSPMSHHSPMKRPSNNPETSQVSTPTPTRSPSPLSSKNKKDKYKPVRNLSFGKPPLLNDPL